MEFRDEGPAEATTGETPKAEQTSRSGANAGSEDVRLAASATKLVGQAVSVLEKELSAGLAAAKALEGRYTDVEGLRNRDPEDIVHRFRKDAHEVVDLLMDLVQIAANSAGGLAQRVIRVRASGDKDAAAEAPSVATIHSAEAAPGQRVTVSMGLENAGDTTVEAVNFIASDLITSSGLKIAASDILFEPELINIAPNSRVQVQISVNVPDDASPGTYSGMLVASKLEQVRAVLNVPVAREDGETTSVDDA